MKRPKKHEPTISVSISLEKKECQVLHDLARRCWLSGGRKLPVSTILKALIRTAKEMRIDVAEVRTESELLQRLKKSQLKD